MAKVKPQKSVVPPRGTFYRSHNRRVGKEQTISVGRLLTGMVIRIKYKAEYRPKHKTSLYVILDPKWKGKIHCVDLDWISPATLIKWVYKSIDHVPATVRLGREDWPIINFKNRGRALYESIKPLLGGDYRTLNIDPAKIASAFIVEYDFSFVLPTPLKKKVEEEGMTKMSQKDIKSVKR